MARVRQKSTRAEINLRISLHAKGLRYRLHVPLLTKPTRIAAIVFKGAKLAAFVDGCFWHGWPEHAFWPKGSAEFWRTMIETNRSGYADTDQRLHALGWEGVRVWEHEDASQAACRIAKLVEAQRVNRTHPCR